MVSKVLQFFNKEVGAVNQAALLLGVFTLISQLLGLVRDRLLTSEVGVGEQLDIYYTAFQVPDFIFNLVATLISVMVVLPMILKITEQKGSEAAQKFFNQVFTGFFGLIIVVCIAGFFLIPHIADKVAPGFSPLQIQELIHVSRIILISPIFLGLSNIFGSITQMSKRFMLFALSPLLYNLGIIFGIVFFYESFGIRGLAYGVVLGSIMHAFIQVPALIKDNMLPCFAKIVDWASIKELILISLPRTLGLVSHNLVLLVLISIATTLGEGSASIFRLSMNLQNIPLALVGASFSVAAFPALAKDFTNGKTKEFLATVASAAKQIIFWSIPITILFIVLRAQIVRIILGSQQFSWNDTRLAAATLALFVISVTAQSLILLFTRSFYATGDTRRPTLINIISSVIIVGVSLLLIQTKYFVFIQAILSDIMGVSGIFGAQVITLAFVYSLGSIFNALVLMKVFQRLHVKKQEFGLGKTLGDSLIGSLVMGLAAYVGLHILDGLLSLSTFSGIFFQGLFAGLFAMVIGIWIFHLLDNQEYISLKNAIQRKFKGVKTISVTHEDIG